MGQNETGGDVQGHRGGPHGRTPGVAPAREWLSGDEGGPNAETLRLILAEMLAGIPADQRAHMTVRLLSELEFVYYAAGVRCPSWVTRTRAKFAAFGEGPPAGETDDDGS